MAGDSEKFALRWSRLKRDARERANQPEPTAPADPAARLPVDANAAAAELPPVDKLTFDSDYRGFFHPKVDSKLRNMALRKLFSDPRFNVLDGLDIYIDDYSASDPLPAEMLGKLKQAQRILAWAQEKDDDRSGRRDGQGALPERQLAFPPPEPRANAAGSPRAPAEAPAVAAREHPGKVDSGSEGPDAAKA